MSQDAVLTTEAQPLLMRHPDVEVPAPTTQEAFDTVWAPKGWELVPAEEVPAVVEELQKADDFNAELDAEVFTGHTADEYTKDYLEAAAQRRNLDTTGSKAALLERLQADEAARNVS